MAKLKLFTYHVILHPEEKEKGKKQEDSQLIIEPKTVLAKDQNSLAFKVTREIPEKYVDMFDRIEIGIAPFNERTKKKADLSSGTSGQTITIQDGLENMHLVNPDWHDSLGTGTYGNMPTFTTTGSVPNNYYNATKILADANL